MMKHISKQSILLKNVSTHFNSNQKLVNALLWFALLLTGVLSWQSASALSLGKLQVLSAANAPLQIAIKVEEDRPGEAEGAAISLASPEDYTENKRQYTPFLAGLTFSATRSVNGELFLRIGSENPLPQKPLNLVLVLIEKDSALKRFYQYTFGISTPENAQAVQNSLYNKNSPKQSQAETESTEVLVVQPGDTMSKIASENLTPDASLQQMLAALYFNNLQAFPERDINLIRSGQKINLPTAAQVQATTPQQIADVVQMLTENFNQYKQKLAQQSQALPKAQTSQNSKGKVSALEVNDPLAQAPDKLTLSAAAKDSTADSKTEAAALAQQKQIAQDQQRQNELEQNVRDLQALEANKTDAAQNSIGGDQGLAAPVPVPTPKIEAVAPSSLESGDSQWLRWWPYAVAALVLLWVLRSLLRLLRSSRDDGSQGFVEDPKDSPSFVPPPSTHDNTTMPQSEGQDPLKFTVSNQHFDLSALSLDLNEPPSHKKTDSQNRGTE